MCNRVSACAPFGIEHHATTTHPPAQRADPGPCGRHPGPVGLPGTVLAYGEIRSRGQLRRRQSGRVGHQRVRLHRPADDCREDDRRAARNRHLPGPPHGDDLHREEQDQRIHRHHQQNKLHTDPTNVMNSIQTALVKSGKVRFARSINEMQQGVDELQRQNQSGLYRQGSTATMGQIGAAKYSMEGELTSIVKQSSATKDVYYKFTLKLFDVQEGTIEWQDEKEIRKTSKR